MPVIINYDDVEVDFMWKSGPLIAKPGLYYNEELNLLIHYNEGGHITGTGAFYFIECPEDFVYVGEV